jgi:aryl-alcohol dehydrogenase-like predicted oxidoreductase
MRYKLLGKSGLRVSELCLGTMTFGQDWGSMLAGASKEESRKIVDSFIEAGGILSILQIYIKWEPVKNMLGNS